MPKESRFSLAAKRKLNRFRGMRYSRPLPTGDKRVLYVLVLHLCFLPWAVGTMHAWSQLTSLSLALIGFAVALTAPSRERAEGGNLKPEGIGLSGGGNFRSQAADLIPPSAWSRLRRFPPFWLGLMLLAYIALQAFNPSWRYATNGTQWWLTRAPNISWLPTSVDVPFARFNIWRQFIIYASAWLTVCTVAIGLTRRRSFSIVLAILSINGLILALVGCIVRLTRATDRLLWLKQWYNGAVTFASFIYKNHAGAYFCLIGVALLVLAARLRERSLRERAPSSPALLPVLGTLTMLFAVAFTYSRGATLLLAAYLFVAAVVFVFHRYSTRSESGTPRVVTFTVAAMVAFVVVFALAQLDIGRIVDRFGKLANTGLQDASVTGRLEAAAASQDMLANTWPRGVGAGEFRHLFPGYIRRFESSYRGGQLFWEHAHNDWLEIPIELGAVGVGILAAGILWWISRLVHTAVWRRLPPLLLTLGLILTPVHAAIDFPFANPAILITWLVMAVIAARYGAVEGTDAVR